MIANKQAAAMREAMGEHRMRVTLPNGYEDEPRSKPVDWNRARVWMRENPPPTDTHFLQSGGGGVYYRPARSPRLSP